MLLPFTSEEGRGRMGGADRVRGCRGTKPEGERGRVRETRGVWPKEVGGGATAKLLNVRGVWKPRPPHALEGQRMHQAVHPSPP